MGREDFISLYKQILERPTRRLNQVVLLKNYIEDAGNETQKKCSDTFITMIANLPPLFLHCLEYAIDYYVIKYSVVKLVKFDPNMPGNGEKIISIF